MPSLGDEDLSQPASCLSKVGSPSVALNFEMLLIRNISQSRLLVSLAVQLSQKLNWLLTYLILINFMCP